MSKKIPEYEQNKKGNNFKTAFKEILNGDLGGNAKNPDSELQYSDELQENSETFSLQSQSNSNTSYYSSSEVDSNAESIIAKDMIIEGNISSSSKIRILGEVKGNVETKSDLTVLGKVDGDIVGNNVTLMDTNIIGNVTTSGMFTINANSSLMGNVKADSITCEGKVEGNINSKKLVELTSTAKVIGDISSQSIKIHENASLKGMVDISSNNKDK